MSARISSHMRRGVAASYSRHRCYPRNSSTSSSNTLVSKPWKTKACVCGCHLSISAPKASNPHHMSFMFFASTTMKFRFHIPTKLRMSSVIAFTRFTSQEKARTWPWLGNAGISCMGVGVLTPGFAPVDRPVDEEAMLLYFSVSLLSGSQQKQGGTEASRLVDVSARLAATAVDVNKYIFKHRLCFKNSERSCDLERHRNTVNVTVELSSFGRPKEEKLKPHLRPLREAATITWSKHSLGYR
ncbi:hypothetical protein Taro_024958 [Colocasia esculenta]|uniref:Uncharacterized protein n=1 Tax=Colocasia esculenta TaxID=4460 RepID=A0A843V856_COLES|nr:hypothetical protein [Colocasia esculenta]